MLMVTVLVWFQEASLSPGKNAWNGYVHLHTTETGTVKQSLIINKFFENADLNAHSP